MNSTYIYSGSRLSVLASKLLSESQLERLLSAKSLDEAYAVLHDTYLSLHASNFKPSGFEGLLEAGTMEARKAILSCSPEPEKSAILWLPYDFSNLRTIIKAVRQNLSDDETLSKLNPFGIFAPRELLTAFRSGKMRRFGKAMESAATEAMEAKESFMIDLITDKHYFKELSEIASRSKDLFIEKYSALLIDIFNIKATLRLDAIPSIVKEDVLVSGGTISRRFLKDKGESKKSLIRLGGEKFFGQAVERYEESNSLAPIEKKLDEFRLEFVKRESNFNVFSVASLVWYFESVKNSENIIRAVLSAKQTGLPEKELRDVLRKVLI
ncbi:MAG: V-type ATPase subunit [bacterium]|nr:V-type ATPase subunit [bacterium]